MEEKNQRIKMGIGSVAVPSVQALAANINGSIAEIPERYVRLDSLSDPVSSNDDLDIPIIDMNKLIDSDLSSEELRKLHYACQDWGFFQLINHGICSKLIERIKGDISEFFKLPLEEKEKFSQLPGTLEGYGQLFVMSDDQKLDWADMLYFNTLPLMKRNVNIWPSNLRDSMDKYSSEVYSLAKILTSFIAKNLRVTQEALDDLFTDGVQSVRINYYPPCPQAEKALGFSPHSDGSALTLVLQINEVHGLQIKKNDEWLSVKPLPDAFVVNVGDTFEILSNGIYRSIEHRAMVNKDKERLSIAAFHSPNACSMISPLHDVLGDGNEAKYKTVSNEEFMELFFSAKLNGKSFINGMKI